MKKVIGDKEVVIISYRHPGLVCSVPEIFGVDNHAYCYRHLKENFSSFYSKQKGSKEKDNALQWLVKIAYARLILNTMFTCMKYVSLMMCLQHGLRKMNLNIGQCQNF